MYDGAMKGVVSRCIVLSLAAVSLLARAAPYIDPKDDPEHFGPVKDILFWKPDQQVAGYRNMEKLTDARRVPASDNPLILQERHADLDTLVIDDATGMTVAEYIDKQSVAGLIVIKDGAIVYERYGLGNDRNSRWISYSVAKSLTSMLVGAAIRDGYIKSVDEKVTDFLPRLKGSAYDQATIRDALQMASGVAWNETYDDPDSDINRATWDTLGLFDYLRKKPRAAPPGETFNYSTAEANLVGDLLRSAIGNNLSTYLEQKIWKPFGMESDAYWNLTEPGGGEFGGCCINATLRDYARLGLFALNNGRLADGTPVLPSDWMADSTTPSKANKGYGYLWWLSDNGAYEASGIFGQGIYVFPGKNLVIALQSARPYASRKEDWQLESELFKSIAGALEVGTGVAVSAAE